MNNETFSLKLKMSLIDTIFETYDNGDYLNTLGYVHDVVIEALNLNDIDYKKLEVIFNLLPIDILQDVLKWSPADTVVRDSMYVWCEKNKTQLLAFINNINEKNDS